MAKLYFKHGTMNSGKSSYLLQAAHNYQTSGQETLIAKPNVDTKSGEKISSRIGISKKINFTITPNMNLFEHFNSLNQTYLQKTGKHISCLFIDEAQFLTKQQANQCLKIAVLLNVPVMCFGLRTDFLTEGFEGSDRLLQIAHSIEELKTICSECGENKAVLNARKENGAYLLKGKKVEIDTKSDPTGNNDTNIEYVNLCASCYMENLPII